jgi:hypothetical protein
LSTLIQVADILTFSWLALCAWQAARRLAAGERCSAYFLIIVHFILCGLPLLLDVIVGQPDYATQPGYYRASREVPVALIYCFYVSFVPIVLYLVGRVKPKPEQKGADPVGVLAGRMRRLNPLLWVFIVSPLVVLLWAPNPGLYAQYGMTVRYGVVLTAEEVDFQGLIGLASSLSVFAVAIWLLGRPKVQITSVYAIAPFLLTSLWLIGKRSILALTILLVIYILWRRGLLVRWRLMVGGLVAVALLVLMSTTYQTRVRGIQSTAEIEYEAMRIDYGRDASIKLVLDRELDESSRPVLEFRGQSLLFYVCIAVPRVLWPEKPWPYHIYFTAAALDLDQMTPLGWGLTSSWLDEAISNFGWLGLVIGPLLLALVCRFGDNSDSAPVEMLTIVVGSLLMSVELSAFSVPAFSWFVAAVAIRIRRRAMRGKGASSVTTSTSTTSTSPSYPPGSPTATPSAP